MTSFSFRIRAACVSGIALLLSAGFAVAADDADVDAAKLRIAEVLEGIEPRHVEASVLPGFYKVQKGTVVGYVSEDGRFLLQGDLIDMDSNVNLTDRARNDMRIEMLADIDGAEFIQFSPQDVKYSVTVFTDIDCTYCRRLHSQIDEYLEAGIQVNYLLWPRSQQGSPGWARTQRVYCSPDRNSALTAAKQDLDFPTEACNSEAVVDQFELGVRMGVRGTPAIVFDDGELLQSYVPAVELLKYLDERKPALN